jgi:biotin synthase
MPPLITRDEALRLGALTDPRDIEALVERAWEARQQHFGDSTDMCSLVNAKSGGCAEDCGFCAQSRFADAETPMHAMLEPDQLLAHAKAAEAAGAHRFCMVTQGQGLSKRDFQKILDGARLVAEQTNLKRCASIGHMSVERAKALKDAGIQRVHHNVETAESYYPEVSTTVRYEGRLRTIDAVKQAGLETCVGGILNLGETDEQRVEMAFELAEINPTSVPINLLNPRPGTKFGDREFLDPWEAVKWVAIFRLILPEALFRLCGGRVENLRELQPLAVKAGVNGVMMGNFLTTLGNTPEQDRAMFEDLGLNIARHPDNGSNPRPDNRAGYLEGETPDLVEEYLDSSIAPPGVSAPLEITLWDPSTQLRYAKKATVPPRPDGAENRWPDPRGSEPSPAGAAAREAAA